MVLSSTSRPAIRVRVIPRLPATLTGSGGISVEKANGIWTIENDWTDLALDSAAPADPTTRQFLVYDPIALSYSILDFETFTDTFEQVGLAANIVQKSDSFTFALTDLGAIVESTKGTAMTGTIPPNSSVALPLNARIDLCQFGAGQLSIAAGVGVTVHSAGSNLKLRTQYSGAILYQRAANDWLLIGDLTS
jgi:hypothetical protein